jgi:hypothetical protein
LQWPLRCPLWVTCGRRLGKNFLTSPACWLIPPWYPTHQERSRDEDAIDRKFLIRLPKGYCRAHQATRVPGTIPERQRWAFKWSGASLHKHAGTIGIVPARVASSVLRLCISCEAVGWSHNHANHGDVPLKYVEYFGTVLIALPRPLQTKEMDY